MIRAPLLASCLLLAACEGDPKAPGGTGGEGPFVEDARAVLDPGEQVLGLRAAGETERVCSPLATGSLQGGRATFTPLPWLAADGFEALVREGDGWRVVRRLPPEARSFEVPGSTAVAVRALRGGALTTPVPLGPPTRALRGGGPPRRFHPPPGAHAIAAGTMEVLLDATLAPQGTYRVLTRIAQVAQQPADQVVLQTDLPVLTVRWNGNTVPFTHAAPSLTVERSVTAGETFELEVEAEHRGDPREVRFGGDQHAYLGPGLAYVATGLRWYAAPADEGTAVRVTAIDVVAPAAYRVAGPGVSSRPLTDAGFSRWRFEVRLAARQLPIVLGELHGQAGARTSSLFMPVCDEGHAEAHLGRIDDILGRFEDVFGEVPAGAVHAVGIDAMPENDPCAPPTTEYPPDEHVATLARPAMIFGPAALWDGEPTPSTDFFFAHEASHQWWGLALNAPRVDGWLTEGLADHAAGLFLRTARGAGVEREVLRDQLPYLHAAIEGGRDVPVRPADVTELEPEIFYVKGSWVFRALEAWMGEERWAQLLGRWAARGPSVVTTADFEAEVRAELGPAVDAFFDAWLRGTGLPSVTCVAFVEPDGAARIEVRQERTAIVGGQGRPFVLPLHAWMRAGERVLSGYALVDGEAAVIPLAER